MFQVSNSVLGVTVVTTLPSCRAQQNFDVRCMHGTRNFAICISLVFSMSEDMSCSKLKALACGAVSHANTVIEGDIRNN